MRQVGRFSETGGLFTAAPDRGNTLNTAVLGGKFSTCGDIRRRWAGNIGSSRLTRGIQNTWVDKYSVLSILRPILANLHPPNPNEMQNLLSSKKNWLKSSFHPGSPPS